ncbi:hypothetical protein B0T16DRAFT_383864 [Cercophora newfieldiana]|uniref:Uncharacterized protein n=1 Tax=Cercophora newfieldiana TaxID=92897 RepID=A0AA39YNJ3_9PEZI|nr:hypothetical protein B0T16DRAFT_383864 [Cercophora newfieldiana]
MARAQLFLQWSLICRPRGLSYLSLLSLSGSTGHWGMFRIMFGFGSGLSTRVFAMMSILLLFLPWLSDLLLYNKVNTTIITVYDTAHTYNATAGVGPFNTSLVEPFIKQLNSMSPPSYPYQILPFSIYAVVYNLMANPWYSTVMEPISCPDPAGRCESYLLSGGTLLMEPAIPSGYDSFPFVKVDNVPAVQLEFTPSSNHSFSDSDCQVFGQANTLIAIRLCVAPSPSLPGSLDAGLFVCRNGTSPSPSAENSTALKCNPVSSISPSTFPNITTSFSLHTRTATLTLAQSNLSITSVSSLSPPLPFTHPLSSPSSLTAYRTALSLLLNFTRAGIPPPSSIAESFWSAGSNLDIFSTSGQLTHSFQSILAFPVWLFNTNNYGNLETWEHDTSSLPGEFHTTARVVRPYGKIKFDGVMVVVYVVLQGAVLGVLWGLWGWGLWEEWTLKGRDETGEGVRAGGENGMSMPVISNYPLFDIVFKARVGSGLGGKEVLTAGDGDIVRVMGEERVHVKME